MNYVLASNFAGPGFLVLYLAIVGAVALIPALLTSAVLWNRTRQTYVWFLVPIFAVAWGVAISLGLFIFVELSG